MKAGWTLFLLAVLGLPAVSRGANSTALHDGWRLQSACKIQADGTAVSAPDFAVNDWLQTTVPNTVLAAQTAAKVFPDPYFGMNLRNIPGTSYPIGQNFANLPMPEDSPYHCGWWYRTEFNAPASSTRNQRTWLH